MGDRSIVCGGCATRYRVPETFSAASVRCKKCGRSIDLAAAQKEPSPQALKASGSARASVSPALPKHRVPGRASHASASHGRYGASKRSSGHHSALASRESNPSEHGRIGGRSGQPKLPAIYILSGVMVLVGIAVVIIFFYNQTRKATESAGTQASNLLPPVPTAKPDEAARIASEMMKAREMDVKKVEEPPKSEAPKPRVSRKLYRPQLLGPLPGVPEETQREIDQLIGTLINLDLTRESDRARNRLIEIGEASVPRLLNKMHQLKLDDEDDIHRGNLLNRTLVALAPKEEAEKIGYSPQGVGPEDVRLREKAVQRWFQWWMPLDEQKRGGVSDPAKADAGTKESPPKN